MATTTQQSIQPRIEIKTGPRKILGLFEDTFETLTGTGPGYLVNERPLTRQEFKDIQQAPEHQVGMPARGSIEFNRTAQVLSQEIAQISSEKSREEALQARRAEVNAKIGIGNTSYEDTVKGDFTLRVDVQTDWNRVNSKLSAEQLKAKREVTVARARGKVERIAGADMKRDFEDRNMGSPG